MNRKFLFFAGAAALAVAFLMLGSTPKANADSFSVNFDIIMCDGIGGGNDPLCADAIGTTGSIGAPNGIIAAGENPEVKTRLLEDLSPLTFDENIFGLANTVWLGITPALGAAITDGDRVGSIQFSIESGLTSPAFNNVNAVTGQPPKCQAGFTLGNTLDLFDAELATSPTVSIRDTDVIPDGLAEEFEDNMLANGSAGSNGLMDGIDVMPDALASTVLPSLGLGNPTSRAFGLAIVSPALGVEATINFVVFDLTADPDVNGYLSVTILNYPGLPGQKPSATAITAQTVITCPPFTSNVRIYGVNLGNPTAIPAIAAGTVNRTAVAGGPYDYRIDMSSGDNYDGDAAAQDFDTCEQAVSINTDLTGGADPDSDRWDSGCDVVLGSGDNAAPPGRSDNIPPLGTWPLDVQNCNVPALGLAGGWDCDQDVDGDGTLNTVDNCPTVPDADVTGDTVVDWQYDQDSDGAGNLCDPAPAIKGDGTGYAVPAPGVFQDHDDKCIDTFSIPGSELSNPPANGFCISAGADGIYGNGDDGRKWNDSNDDGDPDWDNSNVLAGYQVGELIDTNDDSDLDSHTDACEAVKGTDALSAASVPGAPSVSSDCDGGGELDASEEAAGRDFTNPVGDVPACTDRDGDSLCDDATNDPDDDGCTTAEEATLGSVFVPTAGGWYDVYDVPVPASADPTPNGGRNKVVDIGDVLAVLFYAFAEDNQAPNSNGVDYDSQKGIVLPAHAALEVGQMYDRSPGLGPDPVTGKDPVGPPNGVVDIGDVLGTLAQAFVVDCSG